MLGLLAYLVGKLCFFCAYTSSLHGKARCGPPSIAKGESAPDLDNQSIRYKFNSTLSNKYLDYSPIRPPRSNKKATRRWLFKRSNKRLVQSNLLVTLVLVQGHLWILQFAIRLKLHVGGHTFEISFANSFPEILNSVSRIFFYSGSIPSSQPPQRQVNEI